jgi:hypothetical protein
MAQYEGCYDDGANQGQATSQAGHAGEDGNLGQSDTGYGKHVHLPTSMVELELYEQYSKQKDGVSSTQGWIWGVESEKEMLGYNMPKAWALDTAWMRLFASSLP